MHHAQARFRPALRRPAGRAVARILRRTLNGLVRRYRIARDRRHLETMSDAHLKDIGIERANLTSALRDGRVFR